MRKIMLGILAFVLLFFGVTGTALAAEATPAPTETLTIIGEDQEPADVLPEGAVELPSSPGPKCTTNYLWVVNTPAKDEVSHQEYQFYSDVPAYDEVSHLEYGSEERTREYTPAVEEVSHQVYSYKKTVVDYKTQYHFRKFTETKTKSPSSKTWSAYGPWEAWVPETHTSWEDSNAPLGTPEFHGEGTYSNGTQWYRQWQAQADGQTRQVENGSHIVYSGEITTTLGSPWVLVSGYPKTVIDTEAVPASYGEWTEWTTLSSGDLEAPALPENTSTHEYRGTGPVKVVDREATEGYRVYYVEGSGPSLDINDASWVTESSIEGWTLLNERKVVDSAYVPENNDYYKWNDSNECTVDVPPTTPPVTPPVTPPHATPAAVPSVINSGI